MKTMTTILKRMISLAAAVVLTFAFGAAYAANDEMPEWGIRDTGTLLYEAFLKHDADIGMGSAAGGIRADVAGVYTNDELPFMNLKDTGTVLYEAFLKGDVVKGSAAGGIRSEGVSRAGEYTNDELPAFPRPIQEW